MDEIKIRNNKLYLNQIELKSVEKLEIKSTAEDGYAVVKLALLAKLT